MQKQSEAIHFTVVIPTRERRDTLVHCLNSVVAQEYGNFSILVSDNASNDDTEVIVKRLSNPRIRYVNTGRRVSMSHNWEHAINHIDNGWVTVLGDDDALMPNALGKVSHLIETTGTKAIRSNGANYLWPGLIGEQYGQMTLSLRKGFQILDSKKCLLEVLRGKRAYNTLPMLYNGGFVDSELIKRAKSISGAFFHSMTPDVYSAMVFSLLTDEYLYSHEPLAINGASHHSGGTAAFEKKKRVRNYDPAEKFYNENNIPLHKDIPYTESGIPAPSLHACVLEAYLQADSFFSQNLDSKNFANHLRIILRESRRNEKEITEWGKIFANQHNICYSKIASDAESGIGKIYPSISRIVSLLRSISFAGTSEMPLSNVYEASIIAGYVKDVGISPYGYLKNLTTRCLNKLRTF